MQNLQKLRRMISLIKESSKASLFIFFALLLYVNLSSYIAPALPSFGTPTVRSTVTEESIDLTIQELRYAKMFTFGKELDMHINSFGGSVLAGHRLIRYMKQLQSEGYKITCTVTKAMSMGFTILQYCDLRIADTYSLIMQHMIHNGNGRENMVFKTNEARRQILFLDRLHGADEAKRLGITYRRYTARYQFSKWYKGAEACLDGVIDNVFDFKSGLMLKCSSVRSAVIKILRAKSKGK